MQVQRFTSAAKSIRQGRGARDDGGKISKIDGIGGILSLICYREHEAPIFMASGGHNSSFPITGLKTDCRQCVNGYAGISSLLRRLLCFSFSISERFLI